MNGFRDLWILSSSFIYPLIHSPTFLRTGNNCLSNVWLAIPFFHLSTWHDESRSICPLSNCTRTRDMGGVEGVPISWALRSWCRILLTLPSLNILRHLPLAHSPTLLVHLPALFHPTLAKTHLDSIPTFVDSLTSSHTHTRTTYPNERYQVTRPSS